MEEIPQRVGRFTLLHGPKTAQSATKMTFNRLAQEHDCKGMLEAFVKAAYPKQRLEEFGIDEIVESLKKGKMPDHSAFSNSSPVRLTLGYTDSAPRRPQIRIRSNYGGTDEEWKATVESGIKNADRLRGPSMAQRHQAAIDAVRNHLKEHGIKFIEETG